MKTERGYNMLNVIFVLHCSEHSGRATEIVHITECAHSWWKASDVNCFHLHDSQRGLTTVTMELEVGELYLGVQHPYVLSSQSGG